MSPQTVFARAWPGQIRLTEQYAYQTEVSANPRTESLGTPTGLIEIIIPYDGQEHFNRSTVEDINRQVGYAWPPGLMARVGYIGLTGTAHTDLEERLRLSLHHNALPLDIPVQGDSLRGPDDLISDRYACRIVCDYTPEQPEVFPISLEATILDEETIQEPSVDIKETQASPESVALEVAQQVPFKRSLIFAFDLALMLPDRVRLPEKSRPKLAYMALEWPVAISYRSVRLAEPEHPLAYNPEEGVIEWSGIPFQFQGKREGTDLSIYRTPPMILEVDQPGELYRRDRLKGQVRVEIPFPLSALKVRYFNAQGWEGRKFQEEQRTILTQEITLYLEDCFKRRMLSPYQHLQFEGVILDEMRMADIVTLLADRGFVSFPPKELPSQGPGMKRYLVHGSRPEGPEKLMIWILVEGTRSETVRRKQIPGGQTFTTRLETGNMVIYMRGQLRGDSARLLGVMNEIQALLKERFRHVSTIE